MNKNTKKKKSATYRAPKKTIPQVAIQILRVRNKMVRFLDRILIIAQWDRRLRLPLMRKVLSPILVFPGIISILNKILSPLTDETNTLQSNFILIDQLIKLDQICLLIFQASGLMPIVLLIFTMGVFQLLQKDVDLGSELRNKFTRSQGIALLWNFYVLYSTTKYFPVFLQPSLRVILLYSAGVAVIWLLGINRYQKSYGSFEPERILKKNERRLRKGSKHRRKNKR